MKDDAFIYTSELAERYNVRVQTIRNWQNRETLPFPKPTIKRHGRAESSYSIKLVKKWEKESGKVGLKPLSAKSS